DEGWRAAGARQAWTARTRRWSPRNVPSLKRPRRRGAVFARADENRVNQVFSRGLFVTAPGDLTPSGGGGRLRPNIDRGQAHGGRGDGAQIPDFRSGMEGAGGPGRPLSAGGAAWV